MAIVLVEIPHSGQSYAWAAATPDHFTAQIIVRNRSKHCIFEDTTVRELCEKAGYGSAGDLIADNGDDELRHLFAEFGEHEPIYKSFGMTRYKSLEGQNSAALCFSACVAFASLDLKGSLLFLDKESAEEALADSGLWNRYRGTTAHAALIGLVARMNTVL